MIPSYSFALIGPQTGLSDYQKGILREELRGAKKLAATIWLQLWLDESNKRRVDHMRASADEIFSRPLAEVGVMLQVIDWTLTGQPGYKSVEQLLREADSIFLCPASGNRQSRVFQAQSVCKQANIRHRMIYPWHSEGNGATIGAHG